MCFPFAIPLALMIGGSVASFFGGQQADKARAETFNRESKRQHAFEGEQTARFQDSLDSTQGILDPTKQRAAVAAREGSLANAIVSAAPAAGGYLPGASSAPSVVATAADKAGAKSDAGSLNLAHALAELGGTTDQMQRNDIQVGRNSGLIDQIGGFKRGSLSVLDAEMKAAAHKGALLRGLGGLAQSIGGAMAGSAIGGGGGGGFGNPFIPNFEIAV